MGRHTRTLDRASRSDTNEGDRAGRRRRIGKVPLLPAVSAVLAVGAIISAISTKQIALNFAEGTPSAAPSPSLTGAAPSAPGGHGRHVARDGSSLGSRASRGAGRSAITVVFRRTATWAHGFRGEATITNHGGAAVGDWTLAFRYPAATIVRASGVTVVRTGTVLVAHGPASRPSVAPGEKIKVVFTARGSGTTPSACTFNGRTCRS